MKILFTNLIDSATITSTFGSLNYPPENLQDKIVKKRFQSTLDADTIRIDFSDTVSLDCFYYAFTNATLIQVFFLTGSDTIVHSIVIDDPQYIGAYHFDAIDVDFIEIYLTGPLGVYLGSVGSGLEIDFPDPVNRWPEPMEDNSLVAESLSGETLNDYIKPLRVYNWVFPEIRREDLNYYRAFYNNLGLGNPVFMDPFYVDHEFIEPIYAKLTKAFTPNKVERMYDFNLDIKEST